MFVAFSFSFFAWIIELIFFNVNFITLLSLLFPVCRFRFHASVAGSSHGTSVL